MTDTLQISGTVAPGFGPVREALAELLSSGEEKGCQVAATRNGVTIIDLCAGHIDREQAQPVTPDTLIPVYSVSKAISALVIAILVSDGVLDYDKRVSHYWPEFAAEGKDTLTLAQMLSHQTGLPGLPDNWQASDWYDWEKTTTRLAAAAPMWEPGTQSGYHPITWGFLAGEIVRRTTGSTIGTILRERLADPFDLDVWIGLPQAHHHRAAKPRKASKPPHLGDLNDPTKIAFLKPWSSPRYADDVTAWLSHELPAANGHATALGLAHLAQPLARAGMLNSSAILGAQTLSSATQQRIAGQDLVLPFDLSWGAGFIRNTPSPERLYYGPGERTVGHTGFGGSCVFADPALHITFAYATLTHSPALVTDKRAKALTDALYAALASGM